MAHAINTVVVGHSVIARIRHTIETLKATLAARKQYAELVFELESLGERELNDLGINRYDIQHIAHQHVYGA